MNPGQEKKPAAQSSDPDVFAPVGPDFHPFAARSASAVAMELIREAIMDGRLPPGSRLKEEELARQLHISRTPVRQAINVLAGEGLIVLAPNKGAEVRAHSADELNEVYHLRALLEGYGARLAAERISEDSLEELRESCTRFARLRERGGRDIRPLAEENLVFHGTILKAARSEWLSSFLSRITNVSLVQTSYWMYSPELRLNSEHCHRQIVRALENCEGERAELLMKGHILEAKDFLVERATSLDESPVRNDVPEEKDSR